MGIEKKVQHRSINVLYFTEGNARCVILRVRNIAVSKMYTATYVLRRASPPRLCITDYGFEITSMRHVYKYYRHVLWGHGENLSENRTHILSFRQYLAKSSILPDPNMVECYERYKKRGQGHLSKQKAGSCRTERKKERLVNRPNKFGACFILFLCFVLVFFLKQS